MVTPPERPRTARPTPRRRAGDPSSGTPRGTLVALAAFLLLAACEDGRPPTDGAAIDAGACVLDCAPFACDSSTGTCLRTCASDSHCVAGHICQDHRCVGTQCSPQTATLDCGAYACVRGTCAKDCAVAPCAEGYYCGGPNNTCVPRCTTRSDALCGGFACELVVGECEPYCMDGELPCAAGYVCQDGGSCVVDEQGPPCDAGCGAYACLPTLGRCATRCLDDHDCVAPATCADGQCG